MYYLTGARKIARRLMTLVPATYTAVSSSARNSLARHTASRRFVFTRSPAFFGTSEGATTGHSWPRLFS
jgi:hypothetical protein